MALLAAAIVFLSTAALWPRQENLEEKFLAKLDQELGLVPRFLGAKPVLPCEKKENTALPVLCPDAKTRTLTPEELSDEAAEVWSSGNPRLSMFRDLLREDRPEARATIQRQVESRLEKNKNSPTLLNDLAVIHLIRAGKGEEPEGYTGAFDSGSSHLRPAGVGQSATEPGSGERSLNIQQRAARHLETMPATFSTRKNIDVLLEGQPASLPWEKPAPASLAATDSALAFFAGSICPRGLHLLARFPVPESPDPRACRLRRTGAPRPRKGV